MTEQQIMSFIEITAENTGLKVQQKITEAIAAHENGCCNQFNGRIEMVENAVVSLSKKQGIQFDQFGPVIAALFKNWKVLMVVIVLLGGIWTNMKSGKSYTIDELKQVIKQVQETEIGSQPMATVPQNVSTAPKEEKKIIN